MIKIPLVDINRQYLTIKDEIDSAISSVIKDSAFILGKYTEEFERNFARYCNMKYCVGLNSGTDALFFSYLSCGINEGDEVITVGNTFFATIEPLMHLGATPIFIDVDPRTYLLDPVLMKKAITKKTKAIVPVHLFGQMVNMQEVTKIASEYGLKVIEDSAQSHGAKQNGKYPGSFGDIGIYSFYPGKNLGAFGDAGCIVTNDENKYSYIKRIRDHGRTSKYNHDIPGYGSRMDGIQAAILNVKLKYIDKWNKRRREIAKMYDDLLPTNIKKPFVEDNNEHVYHLYTIEVDRRDSISSYLNEKNIQTGVHYPVPLHKQAAYLNYAGYQEVSLPNTESIADRILSLPIFPEIKDEEVHYIIQCLRECL